MVSDNCYFWWARDALRRKVEGLLFLGGILGGAFLLSWASDGGVEAFLLGVAFLSWVIFGGSAWATIGGALYGYLKTGGGCFGGICGGVLFGGANLCFEGLDSIPNGGAIVAYCGAGGILGFLVGGEAFDIPAAAIGAIVGSLVGLLIDEHRNSEEHLQETRLRYQQRLRKRMGAIKKLN